MRSLSIAQQTITIGGRALGHPELVDLGSPANVWDVTESQVVNDRVVWVKDQVGGRDMRPFPGDFALLGGDIDVSGPLPPPLWLSESPRFNGRAAMVSDSFESSGSLFHLWSGLSPNNTQNGAVGIGNADTDSEVYFNAPHGYTPPYWVALLGRCAFPDDPNGNIDTDTIGVWDATHGGKGTGPTVGGKIVGLGDRDWQFSTFGPGLLLISTNHPATVHETVLIFIHVTATGANSFIEVNWRDAGGVLRTERASGNMLPWQYYECFFGWVHGAYLAFAVIGVGIPDEDDLDRYRSWAAPWIPPAGEMPPEP